MQDLLKSILSSKIPFSLLFLVWLSHYRSFKHEPIIEFEFHEGQITKLTMGLVQQIINADRYITVCFIMYRNIKRCRNVLLKYNVAKVMKLGTSFLGLELIF